MKASVLPLGVELVEHEGQLVRLQETGPAPFTLWFILPPDHVNGGNAVGPFTDRRLALDVGACHLSEGAHF